MMNKNNTSIALVDDHSLLRNGLAALINSFEGYTVLFEADNGKDFINQLQIHAVPDIILLDITMPEMNGFETAAWIKQNAPSIKILILSMMDNDEVVISMLKAGARGYILKDSKPALFKQALDSIRDSGFFMNELVSNKMLNYLTHEEKRGSEVSLVSELSEKEIAFLKYACTEMTYKDIASSMQISPRTVDGYRDDLFKKLNVQSRVGLVIFAIKNGLYKL
ncbi:response regulator transcription factor [Terrimonas pollutisoli]|uniref:response regulator transcription factor n=1 Tax=Terrimonas pollutisoli TaxID=3034147 RepID=UPI0023EAEBFF|nr:response regulator transcription factor [Terrimonas sp. H1YJ31]